MIEGLFFIGANFGWDGSVPFFSIVEFRINVNDYTTERIDAMPHNRTNSKFCAFVVHKVKMPVSSAKVKARIKRALRDKAQLWLDALFDFQDLLATIHPGFEVYMMRAMQFTCDFIFNICIRRQCVMRPPHIALGLSDLTLWNSHFIALSNDLAVLIYQCCAKFSTGRSDNCFDRW
jgi:hypothetical protein